MLQTPFYLVKQEEIDSCIESFVQAMRDNWGPEYALAYSFKTNSLPWLLRHFRAKGCFAEVVSSTEYELAVKTGYEGQRIVFNGPVKGKKEFLAAVSAGAIVNIDSERELDWLCETRCSAKSARLGLRVNFSVEDECAGEIGYEDEGTRFGFCYENGELKRAISKLNSGGYELSGLHMHSTSRTRSLNVYRTLASKAAEIIEEYRLEPDYIDIGGGFFGGMPGKPSFSDYVKVIREELDGAVDTAKVMLIAEPGTAMVGAFINFVSTVMDVKDNAKSRIVTIDGSRFNVDPLMIKSSFFYHTDASGSVFPPKQIICGYTCMDRDRIMRLENQPELRRGDRITFEKVGSYTMALSPLFISYFPAVYLDDGENTCIRKAWTVEDYVKD